MGGDVGGSEPWLVEGGAEVAAPVRMMEVADLGQAGDATPLPRGPIAYSPISFTPRQIGPRPSPIKGIFSLRTSPHRCMFKDHDTPRDPE